MDDGPLMTGPSRPLQLAMALALWGAVATGLWFGTIAPMREAQAMKQWKAVPCTIATSKMGRVRSSGGWAYVPRIEATYELDGTTHTTPSVGHVPSENEPNADAVLRRFSRGNRARCFVNPDDHDVMTVAPGEATGGAMVIGLVLLLAGVLFTVAIARSRKPLDV